MTASPSVMKFKMNIANLVCAALVVGLFAPPQVGGQVGSTITVVGLLTVIQQVSERLHEATITADEALKARLSEVQSTLNGLTRDLQRLKDEGVTDLNNVGSKFVGEAQTAIRSALRELSSLEVQTANSLNQSLLELQLTIDAIPFAKVPAHVIGQHPFALRKPASGNVVVDLVGYFPLNIKNPERYPLVIRLLPSGTQLPYKRSGFGHYVFTVPQSAAQRSFDYQVTFPVQRFFGQRTDTNIRTVAIGKRYPFQFQIELSGSNPSLREVILATSAWTKTVRNGEIANGLVTAEELFSACVSNPVDYDLKSVRLQDISKPVKPKITFGTSCGRCGKGEGKVVGWNENQVQYRLRALRTGPHWHTPRKKTFLGKVVAPVQKTLVSETNRSASLALRPTFIASRAGISQTLPPEIMKKSVGRDDVVEIAADLGSKWAIEIRCNHDDGVQRSTSRLALSTKEPRGNGDGFDAEYDGRKLRIATH